MLKSLSLQKLHYDERLAFVLADFVDCTNVGMIQSGSGPRLAVKPLQGRSIGGESIGQELQGNVPPQSQVLSPVDDAHAAATQPFQDPVVRNRLA